MNATTLVSRLLETDPYDRDDPDLDEPGGDEEFNPAEIVNN